MDGDWSYHFILPIENDDFGEALAWLQENFHGEYNWDISTRLTKGLCLEIQTNDAQDAMLLKLTNPNVIQIQC